MAAGRIAVLIDGLDEITPDIQPIALRALSQQASCRIVILSRTIEMASAAASQGVLQGAAAIELEPVSLAEAAGYLERVRTYPPPEWWHNLTQYLPGQPCKPAEQGVEQPALLVLGPRHLPV